MAPADPVATVLAKLPSAKRQGNYWIARCPAHDDNQASLSVGRGTKQPLVLNCHAGCAFSAIVAALGLSMSDVSAPSVMPSRPVAKAQGVDTRAKLVKTYDYHDVDGSLRFRVCRFEPKTFRQCRIDANGNITWGLGDVTPVLYRLPEIVEAVALKKRIYIVEGEKDADALAEYRYPATTSPMGAGKWRDEYSDVLAGADVVILPDNDETGRKHAITVANSLAVRGAQVRVVELPNLPPKGDVSDWLAAGGDFDTLAELEARTPLWSAEPGQQGRRTRFTLRELLDRPDLTEAPRPVVPYLAWASRSTLLAAREKSGKSTLTGFMAAAVSRGQPFLNEPTERGRVLIIGLEEFLGDTIRRLADFGADPDHVELVDALIQAPADRLAEVRSHITAMPGVVLVILDSLMVYASGAITDANNATQMQSVVDGLTQLTHQLGIALVIIHHAKKSDGRYRDSSAIGGAVDVIAEVFCPDEANDPRRRRVRPIGRVPTRAIDFRFDGRTYVPLDADGQVAAPLDQRITDLVRERPGITANDVAEAIGGYRKQTLEQVKFMVRQGLLDNSSGSDRWYALRLPTSKLL